MEVYDLLFAKGTCEIAQNALTVALRGAQISQPAVDDLGYFELS